VFVGSIGMPAAALASSGCASVFGFVTLTPLQPATLQFIGPFNKDDLIEVLSSQYNYTISLQESSGAPYVLSGGGGFLHSVVQQGVVAITLTNNANATNTLNFRCTGTFNPAVTTIAPATGNTGTSVALTGINFDTATAVNFGSAAAAFTINSATSITAIAPAGSGVVDIWVIGQGGSSGISVADQFTYPTTPAPTVTAITPAIGPTTGGTSVTIRGTGFSAASAVTFGSTAAASFTVVNTTTITATSPAGTGVVDVTVTNSGGTSANGVSDLFTFVFPPPVAGPKNATASYNSGGSTSTAIDLSTVISGGPATGVTVTAAASHGSTTVSGTTVTYTPTTGYYGTDSFSYTASGPGGTSSAAMVTITVSPPVIAVSPASPPAGKIGVAYSQTLTASGGNGPYAFTSVASGALPPGLSLSNAGVISGTPTATGTFNFTVSGTDSSSASPAAFTSASISIAINLPTLGLTPAPGTALAGVAETAYSQAFAASGGTAPYSYAALVINSGALPAGLSFSTSTGILSGKPTATGTVNFTVAVTDSSTGTGPFTVSGTYTLVVATATVTLSPGVLPVPTVGAPYNQVLTASGGLPPYAFATTGGSLPAGLILNPAGTITGTPTAAGGYSFVVTVTDAHGFSGGRSYTGAVGAPAATTTALLSSLNPSRFRDSVTFTATVASAGGMPAGAIAFRDGANVIGTSALTGGTATLVTTSLSVGTHMITASFGGGGGFEPSTSTALAQMVAIPADSARLRQMQVAVTRVVSQTSGQAIAGSIDQAITDGFNDGGVLVTPSGGGLRFNFSADPDQPGSPAGGNRAGEGAGDRAARLPETAHRVDDAFAAINNAAPVTKAPAAMPREAKEWLLWANVSEAGIDRWGATLGSSQSQLYGSQVNALVGLTRRLTPSFLLGVVGGYETFDYTSQDVAGRLKGQGWTLGSYLGWKLAPAVRLDAAVAYSGIGYDGTAGTAQGDFSGRRWMASSGLTGTYRNLGFDIEPSAKVYALWERENAYTDSLGTLQADRDFLTGRASGGARLSYPVAWSDSIALAPYVGLYGDYYFSRDDAALIAPAGAVPLASVPLLDGWSARAIGGLAARFAGNAAVAVGGEFGGIGGNIHIWTYRARATVPF
jgi:Autotransporter beta-domain/Bacterial Ig-like domain (group 3)/Putative Ig domain/IPT/TIG domain